VKRISAAEAAAAPESWAEFLAADPDRKPETIACHEAGHAIAGLVFGGPFRPKKVVLSDDDGDAHCYLKGPRRVYCHTPEAYAARCPRSRRQVWADHALNDAILSLAGPVAGDRFVGDCSYYDYYAEGSSADFDDAERALRCAYLLKGRRFDVEDAIDKYLDVARDLVDGNWTQITRLAAALLERRELSYREIIAVVGDRRSRTPRPRNQSKREKRNEDHNRPLGQ
jgi:hypothetical protein